MNRVVKILISILLIIAILFCVGWYLFVYDREFTRDVLISGARFFEENGNHNISTWLYDAAYMQSENRDVVAIELAQQYIKSGNYTKAEYTLTNAIADGAGAPVYIALSKAFVEQDKLIDAVKMLEGITNPDIRAELERLRPQAPTSNLESGLYNDYLEIELQTNEGQIYFVVNDYYPSVRNAHYTEPLKLAVGVNDIQAIAVAENGLVSPVAHYTYTIGGIIERIHFNDPKMEAQIRSILGVGERTHLYTNDLWSIKQFTVPTDVSDYSDLALLPYLESLTIKGGKSDQLEHIASLQHLKELIIQDTPVAPDLLAKIAAFPALNRLTLDGCSLSSINELEAAKALQYLDLSNNTIRNISVFSLLPNLQELYMPYNALTDLSALTVMQNLISLDVSHNTITSISPLSNVTSLKELNAQYNQIDNIQGIGKLTSLQSLSLAHNAITGIADLGSCTALQMLDISFNQIADITALSTLNHLMHFNFSSNQITQLPAWDRNCALVSIIGANNTVTSVAQLRGLAHLNEVNLEYNPDLSAVDDLAECPLLVLVNIHGTSVKDVSALRKMSVIVNYDPTVGE